MKTKNNHIYFSFRLNLQEEFAPYRGSSTGVVAQASCRVHRDIESLPLAAHLHRHCVWRSAGEAARGLRAGADVRVHAAGLH